jgi:hypothetical protein
MLRKGPIPEEEFDYDYYIHFYAWIFTENNLRISKEDWVVDVGGKKLANTVLAGFCKFLEITPTNLNFSGSGRHSICNIDFGNFELARVKIAEELSGEMPMAWISPATLHLMDKSRYRGVSSSISHLELKSNNFLRIVSEFISPTGYLFLSVPITFRESILNKQGYIYSLKDLRNTLAIFGFEICNSSFVTHGSHNIESIYEIKQLINTQQLNQVNFVSKDSYVIGFICARRISSDNQNY